jgi:high-affinity iron transporter
VSHPTGAARRMALALACFAVLLVAGCGGGDETASSTAESTAPPQRYAGVKAYRLAHTGRLAVRTDELARQADRYYALARDARFDYRVLVRDREGLEAVLILAAITASMVGALAQRRRPVMVGAALGLVASIVTWVLAQLLLESLSGYGERLEAVDGVIAIAVLLLVMNWFFHKVYWTEHIRRFHKRRKCLVGESDNGARVGFWSAQVVGFGVLGLTSVYREGFEPSCSCSRSSSPPTPRP